MSYSARVLRDSISPDGVRLTTAEVVHPRFILAEVNTHRVLSRNSASSRAIPVEKNIDRIMDEPFVPETFNARVKGMGVGDALDERAQANCRDAWTWAMFRSVEAAKMLVEEGVDKSRANRLLEPFMWHTAIITSTEWENFFALRTDEGAQPEFQIIAGMLREAIDASEPVELSFDGEKVYERWHLPLVDRDEAVTEEVIAMARESGSIHLIWPMVSAGRCARVSYDTHENYEEPEKSYQRAQRLMANGHLSPFEHVARPFSVAEMTIRERMREVARDAVAMGEIDTRAGEQMIAATHFLGNARGWHQLRKDILNEDNFARLKAATVMA